MSEPIENPRGFDDELRALCAGLCGDLGEPPCYRLPSLSEGTEIIRPCQRCRAFQIMNNGGLISALTLGLGISEREAADYIDDWRASK